MAETKQQPLTQPLPNQQDKRVEAIAFAILHGFLTPEELADLGFDFRAQ